MGKTTTVATGSNAGIHIGSETSWGEPVSPTHAVDFTSESIAVEEETIQSEAISGDRGTKFLIQGSLNVGGDISFENSAEGFGLLTRHALGDYIRLQRTDGGVHGRINHDELHTLNDPDGNTREIISLAEDHSGGFNPDADTDSFALVYRDANGNLMQEPDTTAEEAGYNYESYCAYDETSIKDVNTSASGNDPVSGTADADEVTLRGVVDLNGNTVAPSYSKEGGIVKLGASREEFTYYYAEQNGSEVTLYFNKGDIPTSGLGADDGAVIVASFATHDSGGSTTATTSAFTTQNSSFSSDNEMIDKGTFAYLYDDDDASGYDYSGVWTHHLERGEDLPTGLTVEVDRSAAVFIYSGLKVDSLSLEFDTNSIVTGTFTLTGQNEYIHDELRNDVASVHQTTDTLPRTIEVEGKAAQHWPNPKSGSSGDNTGHSHLDYCEITIGEETEIKYTEKSTVTDSQGNVEKVQLTLVDSTGGKYGNDDEIERYHKLGTSVALRTSTKVQDPYEPTLTPLTSFETNVYMDGTFEEALSGSLTLNNNVNGDKYGLGQRQVFQLTEEDVELEASLTFEFDDAKHYKRFREAEYFSLEFKCISEAEESRIDNTDVLSQAYYLLPKCKFDGSTPTVDDESFIQSDFPVMPVLDTEMNNTDLIAIVVNGSKLDARNN